MCSVCGAMKIYFYEKFGGDDVDTIAAKHQQAKQMLGTLALKPFFIPNLNPCRTHSLILEKA